MLQIHLMNNQDHVMAIIVETHTCYIKKPGAKFHVIIWKSYVHIHLIYSV